MNDTLIAILAQDRKHVVLLSRGTLEVTRNIGGGKDGKYAVIANSNELVGTIIGSYAEEKDATDALEKLFAAIAAGEKTYIMN